MLLASHLFSSVYNFLNFSGLSTKDSGIAMYLMHVLYIRCLCYGTTVFHLKKKNDNLFVSQGAADSVHVFFRVSCFCEIVKMEIIEITLCCGWKFFGDFNRNKI